MRFSRLYMQLLAAGLAAVTLVSLVVYSASAPRAAVTGSDLESGGAAFLTPSGEGAGLLRATSSDDAVYRTALGIWDGAVMAGDDRDASRWLSAGLLISRGEYPAARQELREILDTAPADSPLSLKAEMFLAGTAGGRKLIALAFDDFPFPDRSPRLLEVLARLHVPATFFAIGHKVREYPDVVALALTQGHSIQNHTYHHIRLADLPAERVREELNLCSQAIRDYTGVTPRFLRAPHAASNATVNREAKRCGLTCIDPIVTNIYDMTASSETIYRRCLQMAKPGAILALHDGLATTTEAMPRVIAELRNKGYEFVTVDQLLGSAAPAAQAALAGTLDLALWPRPSGPAETSLALLSSWSPRALEPLEPNPDGTPN